MLHIEHSKPGSVVQPQNDLGEHTSVCRPAQFPGFTPRITLSSLLTCNLNAVNGQKQTCLDTTDYIFPPLNSHFVNMARCADFVESPNNA